jgi:UDP-glucuronate decarboxylase
MGNGDLMPRRVMVTGGAGFLGSHLCQRLLNDNAIEHVWCVDNLQTGSIKNISGFMDNPRFSFINQDIIDPIDQNVDPDLIYNFACAASPPRYQKDPIHTMKSSVIGCLNLADMAVQSNARLFHTSTSEVYGDPQVTPQSESYWGNVNPVGVRSCYDEGKRAAETILFDYARTCNLDLKLVRIFNTYGPRMSPDDGRVVSNFIVQALTGQDITIYGDGSQTRSFCYVDDLIDVFFLFNSSEKQFQGPLNTGNPVEFTILELAEKVLSLTGTRSKLVFRELPQDDPKQRRPDISEAKRICGWEPKVSLEDGLKETIGFFKHQLK